MRLEVVRRQIISYCFVRSPAADRAVCQRNDFICVIAGEYVSAAQFSNLVDDFLRLFRTGRIRRRGDQQIRIGTEALEIGRAFNLYPALANLGQHILDVIQRIHVDAVAGGKQLALDFKVIGRKASRISQVNDAGHVGQILIGHCLFRMLADNIRPGLLICSPFEQCQLQLVCRVI